MNFFSKKNTLILGAILLLALLLRLYKFSSPIADWHSWRQADTAAVARNFSKDGIDLLKPRYDDLSNVQTGQYNPEGLRYVEFPIYQSIIATFHSILPIVSIEQQGRLVTILFSLITISIIYFLLYFEEGQTAAIAAALTYAVFPFFVYYSRVILPDTPAVSFMFMGIFFAYMYAKHSSRSTLNSNVLLLLSMIMVMSGLLTKPTVIFYLLPVIYLMFKKYGFGVIAQIPLYIYFIGAIAPLAAWRLFITQFPQGIPASDWLFFGVNTGGELKSVFFRPAFFRWIFFERILILLLGGYTIVFLMAGIIKKPFKSALFYSIGASALLYLFTFQGGNVQHDYYQVVILPAVAIFVGLGVSLFLQLGKKVVNQTMLIASIVVIFAGSWLFSYERVKDYYNISESMVSTSQAIKLITEEDAIVVTDTVGDTTLLYNANRRGYPAVTEDLHDLHKRGADYFVTDKPDVITEVKKVPDFTVVFESNKATIFKL